MEKRLPSTKKAGKEKAGNEFNKINKAVKKCNKKLLDELALKMMREKFESLNRTKSQRGTGSEAQQKGDAKKDDYNKASLLMTYQNFYDLPINFIVFDEEGKKHKRPLRLNKLFCEKLENKNLSMKRLNEDYVALGTKDIEEEEEDELMSYPENQEREDKNFVLSYQQGMESLKAINEKPNESNDSKRNRDQVYGAYERSDEDIERSLLNFERVFKISKRNNNESGKSFLDQLRKIHRTRAKYESDTRIESMSSHLKKLRMQNEAKVLEENNKKVRNMKGVAEVIRREIDQKNEKLDGLINKFREEFEI